MGALRCSSLPLARSAQAWLLALCCSVGAAAAGADPLDDARAAYRAGDDSRALSLYRAALTTVTKPDRVAEAHVGIGRVHLKRDEFGPAIAALTQADAVQPLDAGLAAGLAFAHQGAGNLAAAQSTIERSLASWDALRRRPGLDEVDRLTLLEQQGHAYRLAQQIAMQRGQPLRALEIAEQTRARSLVERLLGAEEGGYLSVDDIRTLASRSRTTILYYSVTGRELRVDSVEQEGQSWLYIWVVSPQGEVTHAVVDLRPLHADYGRYPLNQLAGKTRRLVALGRNTVRANQTFPVLHQLLIDPVLDALPGADDQPLLVVADSALHLLPFPAFSDAQGRMLIDRYILSFAPSLGAYAQLAARPARGERWRDNPLVIGNPTPMPSLRNAQGRAVPLAGLKGAELEAALVANRLGVEPLLNNAATLGAVLDGIEQRSLLHFATHGLFDFDAGVNEFGFVPRQEESIARKNNVVINSGAVVMGKGVAIGGVRADVAAANERVARIDYPGLLALAPPGDISGFLSARRVAGLELRAGLAVLSACDTGRGRVAAEGVVGIARAFMAAGVPSVVMSLWSLPDQETVFLMDAFYAGLDRGEQPAAALRGAMLATRARYPAAKNWAGFALLGRSHW